MVSFIIPFSIITWRAN